MTPTEFKQCRQVLGLTQKELARLLRLAGNGGRSIRHYEKGDRPVPGPISLILDMLCHDFDPMAEHDALARGDVAPKWARDTWGY